MKKNAWASLLSVKEMYLADQITTQKGTSGLQLMETAGEAVTKEIVLRWPKCKVVVLCGPGNNGGDGFVVARLLQDAGWPVRILLRGDKENLPADAKTNAERWDDIVYPLKVHNMGQPDLIIDALFGAGLVREISGEIAGIIQTVNALATPVVAIDIPSGVHADSGQILGTAIKANLCVTFCRAKTGHYLIPGRGQSDELIVSDIGIDHTTIDHISPKAFLITNAYIKSHFPWPRLDGHKYQRGHGVVIGGTQMSGAARLGAVCARRVGAGLITIACEKKVQSIYQQSEAGNLVSSEDIQTLLKDPRKNAVLVGPGLGLDEKHKTLIYDLIASEKNLILDADALTFLSQMGEIEKIDRKGSTLLTPHEGEFLRLFPHINGSKIERVRAASVQSNCTILLKGPDTLIAQPDGKTSINSTGTPWLATAGSGDCLAGICLGLMAQGLTGFDAATLSAWLHGTCAEQRGAGLIAEDIQDMLPLVLQSFHKVSL